MLAPALSWVRQVSAPAWNYTCCRSVAAQGRPECGPAWKGEFRQIDANRFTCQVYSDEKEVASCTIFRGGMGPRTIYDSQGVISTANGWNEALTVEADEGGPYLTPMGMAMHFRGQRPNRMEPFDAAQFLFEMLLDQARSRVR
jgi:hypothetical protein